MKYYRWLLSVILSALFIPSGYADPSCSKTSSSEEVIAVFEFGIAENKAYIDEHKKIASNVSADKYASYNAFNGLQQRDRDFYENVMSLCQQRAVEILSSTNDLKLAHEFLKMIVAYENSADEQKSFFLGKIYSTNPSVIESSIKDFPEDEYKIIYNSLEFGWENVKYDMKQSKNNSKKSIDVKKLDDRLLILKKSVKE